MKKIFFIFILSLFVMPGFFVYAQEIVEGIDPNNPEWQSSQPLDNGVNCFDYYQFQSVQVSVSPEKDLFQPGEPINFIGQIINNNPYPIVDGNLYVRISEKNENFTEEGNYVVEEFFGLENIALEKNGTKDVRFTWNVPVMMPKGQYNVDYFFTVGKKFNLGGLPFSNEVVAGSSQFEVDSIIDGFFSFDRMAVTMDGQPYKHIGDWAVVDKGADVEFGYVLRNTLGHTVQAQVTFDTYFWDSILEKDLIKTETRAIAIPQGESVNMQFVVSQVSESVYYVRARATADGISTIVNTRFAVNGGEHARLNYPAITNFPLKKGDDATLFTCFHNTTDVSTKGSVNVRISDKNGKEITSASYSGDISSAMNAIKKDIKAEKDYDYLKLEATVKDMQGNVIDSYETEYSCEKMNSCKEDGMAQIMPQNPILKWIVYTLLMFVFVIILLVIVKVVKGHKTIVSIFFIMFLFGGVYGLCDQVHAGTWSATSHKGYSHGSGRYDGPPGWPPGGDIFTYVVASGDVTLTNSITGNNSAACEGSITYSYAPSLFFTASGGSWDTPYGAVCGGSDPSPCINSSQTQNIRDTSGRNLPGEIRWSSGRPSVTLSSSNNAIMQCSGMTCTAKPGQSGTVNITARFSDVQSMIYSRISTAAYTFSPSHETYGVASGKRRSDYFSKMVYDGSWHNRTNRMPLGGSSVSWSVTVASCSTNGACNSAATRNDYVYTAAGPVTPLCSAGTPSPATVSFPAGAYGASSAVSWTCIGTGGGTTASCSAARLAPAASCGSANGVMTGIQPVANLCGVGSVLVNPPGVTLNGTTWQWSCIHSINPGADPQTVNCSAPTPSTPCTCDSAAARNDYNYRDPGPTTPLCTSPGTPSPATVSFPVGKYGADSAVTWTCSNVNCMGTATCTAQRNFPSIDCGTASGTTEYNSGPPTTNLCPSDGSVVAPDHSTTPPIPRFVNGQWQWACQHNVLTTVYSGMCSAPTCITGRPITATTPVIINRDNDQHTVVSVSCPNLCCEVVREGTTIPVTICSNSGTSSAEIQIPAGGANLTSMCWFDDGDGNPGDPGDTPKTPGNTVAVQTACTARSCNTQRTCQATAQIADSLDDCSSTCNSDADCSSGRMIETRP